MDSLNPFDITKATDFSDQQIHDYWVDIGKGSGFLNMVKPSSPMPMLILGGKGSGKTHLMRYFSFPLQKIRHQENILAGIKKERYLGVYFRCGGLNASRFRGKGQEEERWNDVFAYFMELWFGQLVLQLTYEVISNVEEFTSNEKAICDDIVRLFDSWEFERPKRFSDLIEAFGILQKRVNTAVNNSSMTHELNINITATAGELTFGVPTVLSSYLPSLKDIRFVYLVDEFENITESQQKYINSLLRERKDPCTFKIGARLYGVKTYGTLSAEEENKEGAEFDLLYLDSTFRKDKERYADFAERLCLQRLSKVNYSVQAAENCFEDFPKSRFAQAQVKSALQNKGGRERPYFTTLQKKLTAGYALGTVRGLKSKGDIKVIINNLKVPKIPLLEKANIFLLYQDWYSGKNLLDSSHDIADACRHFIESPLEKSKHQDVLSHYKGDLLAQLLRECHQQQSYLGLKTFVKMSNGLPRNLLVILKNVFKWSVFYGEEPFHREKGISKDSQKSGVKESSEWFFYHEARMGGANGQYVRAGVARLATLFRQVRFSDKPSECSLLAFSTNYSELSSCAKEILDLAVNWSLLIKVGGGQRDRNSKRVDNKYQINSMLAPHWDLPVSRRGALSLSAEEVNAIFDPNYTDRFETLTNERIKRMNAPTFGKEKSPSLKTPNLLPGFGDD
jgi:hypothetical protein